MAFDVDRGGTGVYTNGSAVYILDPGDVPRRIEKANLIDQVSVLEEDEAEKG